MIMPKDRALKIAFKISQQVPRGFSSERKVLSREKSFGGLVGPHTFKSMCTEGIVYSKDLNEFVTDFEYVLKFLRSHWPVVPQKLYWPQFNSL